MFAVFARLAVRPTRLLAALVLVLVGTACDAGTSTTTAPSASGAAKPGEAKALGPDDIDPCRLLPSPAVEQAVGRPVTRSTSYRTSFVLPGLRPTAATECDFKVEPGTARRAVHVRVGAVEVEAIGAALARFESAGISRLDAAPAPAVAGYWQSVGRTAWLVGPTKVASVQIVTDAEVDADRDAALALAAALLSASEA